MSPTTIELMAYAVSRRLRSEDLVFIGVGTAGRAYTLAVGIPLVASRLAQLDHAPDLDIYLGNLLSPDLAKMPTQLTQDAITRWPGAHAPADIGNKVDALVRGDFTVSFESAAQVDRWGNLNITAIGAEEAPDVRLVGTLAQPEHLAFVERPIIVVDLSPRTFVEEVDVISSFGHASAQGTRSQLGYSTGGPALVVTDVCTFDFTEQGLMRLNSLHSGATLEQVLERMGFEPVIPEHVPQTPAPSEQQIRLIREEIDPGRALLQH